MYSMKSSGIVALVDLVEALEINDRTEGDLGMDLDDSLRSWVGLSGLGFFTGESPLLNVNVRLFGRSRFVETADALVSNDFFSGSSGCESCEPRSLLRVDLVDFCPVVSPADDCPDAARDMVSVSSLCVRTKSALTSSFNVRIAVRWCWGMFLDSYQMLALPLLI
jgi:hypothetical protein